jgi:rfaE bifunctional protein kinase chain/domain
MIAFDRHRLKQLFDQFDKVNLIVIGDLMLDRYVWGRVRRISPEAPVPVVEVDSESVRLGGAANVALNVSTLGASVFPVGVIGDDQAGKEIRSLFKENHFRLDGLLVDKTRPTTVKSRIIADSQHVVRTDWEKTHSISAALEHSVLSILRSDRKKIHGIILEDYNKGVFSPGLIQKIVSLTRENDIMTFVDPKFDHFFDFQHVTLFKPNRKEVADRLGLKIRTRNEIGHAAQKLFERLHCESILITLGEDGMMLFTPNSDPQHIPTRAMKVHDVSGAGDTVIATMAVSMTSGCTLPEAATLANHAAGIVCGEVGIVPVQKKALMEEMLKEHTRH